MSDPNGGPRRFSTQTALAFVLTATFVAYAVTLRFNFVYDDLGQIVANPLVQSWDNVSVYFRGNVWMQQSAVGNYYRPIFLLWLLVNYTLFGLHPFFWHMTNVMAHLVATGLVFAVAHRLSGDRRVAIFAALVFGVHPVHLESVAWVSGVTEPLLAILLLASFLAYLEFRARGRSWRWLGLCGALYSFALLAKETAVVFPALLMAYELLFQRRDEQRKKGPAVMKAMTMFVLLTGAYLLARAQALHGLAHTTVELPTKIRVLTIPSVVWFYFKTLVAPVKLSAFYDTPYITHVSAKYVVVPITGVAIILGLLVWWWRKSRSPLVALGALWILLPIAPLLNLSVLPLGDFVHDRYLYLPSIGFALLAGMVLAKLDNRTLIGRPAGTLVALVMATACVLGTIVQSLPWADDVTLYYHGMQMAPNNDLPRNKLASTFVERGLYEQGSRLYQVVLGEDPDYWYANWRMGFAQYQLGRYAQSEKYLAHAAALHPTPEEFYYLGMTRMRLGKPDAAETALDEAIRLRPAAVGYRYALGMAQKQQGKLSPALESFRAELAANPTNDAARQAVDEMSKEASFRK